MSYKPSKDTIDTLRDIYELKGSYAGVARDLNKGRRAESKQFTANQVRRMLNRENVGGDGSGYTKENAPLPVNLTDAQQRSLQRKSKETSRTYEKAYDENESKEEIYNKIKQNIANKRERLVEKRDKLLSQGQRDEAERLLDEINALNKFDEELDETARNARKYKDWKGMQDAETP